MTSMSEEERQLVDRYHQLIQEVDDARAAYYNRDAPVLSDAEYDKLYRELEDFEAPYRPLRLEVRLRKLLLPSNTSSR